MYGRVCFAIGFANGFGVFHNHLHARLNLQLALNLGLSPWVGWFVCWVWFLVLGLVWMGGPVVPVCLLTCSVVVHTHLMLKISLKLVLNLGCDGWGGWDLC